MADVTLQFEERVQDRAEKDSPVEYFGIANFVTTETTATLPVKLKNIKCIHITPIKPSADELVWADVVPASGVIDGSGGTVSIKRSATSPTSGMAFSFSYRGNGE